MSTYRTLGDLRRKPEDPIGRRGFHATCDRPTCGHTRTFDIERLIEQFGRDYLIRDFERRLVCRICGARGPNVRVAVTWDRMPSGYPSGGGSGDVLVPIGLKTTHPSRRRWKKRWWEKPPGS
jgi:hypothetical protein